jgi:hypothetical protein
MRKSVILFCLVIAALLAACQRAPEPVPMPRQSVMHAEPSAGEVIGIDLTSFEAVPAEQSPNECLECHTDKQRLIESAKEEELVESESEGVG